MMNLNIKTLDRICFVLVVLVSLVCAYWVVKQSVKQRREITQEDQIISKRVKELKSAEENFEQLNQLLKETKRELESMDKRIPMSADIGGVLKQLDVLVKNRNILLLSLQPLPMVEEKLYTKIPIRLMFEGSFGNIYNLLYDLETMNRMLVTESMTISRPNLNNSCQVDLAASVFQR
jgi:Tfp pilus assembly protein PilO